MISLLVLPDQNRQIARLFSFLMLGERLAHDCAAQQEAITSDASVRRFLSAQARQEGLHAQVFQKAITWLAPRGINRSPGFAPIEQYRKLIQDAIRREDFTETLLAQQVILEGLGEVILNRISMGIDRRGLGFNRIRQLLMNQEHAHYQFGLRRLEQILASGDASAGMLQQRGREYLGLIDAMFDALPDLFDSFDEDSAAYRSEHRRHLPQWLT